MAEVTERDIKAALDMEDAREKREEDDGFLGWNLHNRRKCRCWERRPGQQMCMGCERIMANAQFIAAARAESEAARQKMAVAMQEAIDREVEARLKAEGERDNKSAWVLADRIMSISYQYAVKMHESIAAGKGAVGWDELKHAAEIVTAIGDALDGAVDAAEVAYRRGHEAGSAEEREACAMLHESVPNECDRDLHRLTVTGCGCGAMGAVIAYRDAIRKRGQRG